VLNACFCVARTHSPWEQYHVCVQLLAFTIIAPYISSNKWKNDFLPPRLQRHRASAAPRARDGTCFGDCESARGKGTLIAVTKALHAPEARSTVVDIIIKHAGGGERLGCVQAEPFHHEAPMRRYPLTVPATDAVAMIAVA
jgi:hypothetical protein